MSQIYKPSASGGGGTGILTMTPNSGGAVSAVADNINVFGLAANSGGNAFPTFSYNGGAGLFQIEDRAFVTPYVVDPSVTNGQKGTFQTIQAAVTQANADGTSVTNIPTILIRKGQYTENVTIPANMYVNIMSINARCSSSSTPTGNPVTIIGNMSVGSGCVVNLMNLNFTPPSGYCVDMITAVSQVGFYNCQLGSVSGGGSFRATLGYISASYCIFSGDYTISTPGNPGHFFDHCQLQGTGTITAGIIVIEDCTLTNAFTLSGTASCSIFDTGFYTTSTQQIAQNSSSPLLLVGCYFDVASVLITGSGVVNVAGNTVGTNDDIWSPSIRQNMRQLPNQSGNVIKSRVVTATGAINDYDFYIGVNGNVAAVTLTFPSSVNMTPDQYFIIKDESGTASTLNITLATTTGTIDGNATAVINVNYGCLKVKSDGTNFFII